MYKKLSIKTHLIIYMSIAILSTGSIGAYLGYLDLKHEANEFYDSELMQSAHLLLAVVAIEDQVIDFSRLKSLLAKDNDFLEESHDYDEENRLGYQVWGPNNTLLFKSHNLPTYRLDGGKGNLSYQQVYKEPWRIYSAFDSFSDYTVITAEPLEVRSDLIQEAGEGFFQIFLTMSGILIVSLYVAAAYSLRPLQKLSKDILRQDEHNLIAFENNNQTVEIQNITQSLNNLVNKVNDVLEREKQLTTDAAHELRTPLAGIKLHAELAYESHSINEKNDSLTRVMQGVDKSAHIVSQLLTLSRLEPNTNPNLFTAINFTQVLLDELDTLAPLIKEKEITLKIEAHSDMSVLGEANTVHLLVSNLLSNAVRYSPKKGSIRIQLVDQQSTINWTVEDNGKGISDAEKERVFDRFYRVSGNENKEGCGIGLSIVKRAIELLGAKISLQDAEWGQGLCVRVTLRAP